MPSAESLLVFISHRDNTCCGCGEELGKQAWITLEGEGDASCLSCAGLDHLVYLPAGNAALTRWAKKHSTLSAVVLKWSRARKRNERPGVEAARPSGRTRRPPLRMLMRYRTHGPAPP